MSAFMVNDDHIDPLVSAEHTILIAVVIQATTREEAHQHAMGVMPNHPSEAEAPLISWWIAEDDRHDGSDCDSAVFVDPGAQLVAHDALRQHDLTSTLNRPSVVYPTRFEIPERDGFTDAEVIGYAAHCFAAGVDDMPEDLMTRLRLILGEED